MESVSVLIPCLNEANTLAVCINKARQALNNSSIVNGEIIVADNGSTDGSTDIAIACGAKLENVAFKGYGAALDAGIKAATTEWIFFADGDNSYDFLQLCNFIPAMQQQNDFVIGNRFRGRIEKGAMPLLHRYLGTPVLSWLGRRTFKVRIGDFNCGMRAIKRSEYLKLEMKSTGMEFASEMIAKAALCQLKIAEVPVNLYKDGRGRNSHLNTWKDGWKHLRLMLLLSPQWFLLFPAVCFLLVGFLLGSLLLISYVRVYSLVLDIHTLYYASVMFMVGIQLLQFYIIARLLGAEIGLYPANKFSTVINKILAFEKALVSGSLFFFKGIGLTLYAVYQWKLRSFGTLDPTYIFRIIIPAGFCISLGMQMIVFGFLLYTLRQFRK